jgi:hypothetical protein
MKKVPFLLRKTLSFYNQSLKYLEKWFDFSNPYKIQFLLLKKGPPYSDFKQAAVVLNLKMSVNLDELYVYRILYNKAYTCIVSEWQIQANSFFWWQMVSDSLGSRHWTSRRCTITPICTIFLHGTSVLDYELLQEKLMQ